MKLARAGAFVGTLAVATTASVFFAAPAFAHTPILQGGCEGEKSYLTVELRDYVKRDGKKNSVTVTMDGEVVENTEFDKNFPRKTYSKSSAEKVVFKVDIKAWDDPDGSKRYTRTEIREIDSCVEEQPPAEEPPAEEPPAEEPPAEQPPAEEPPAESSSVAVSPTTTAAPTSVAPIAAEETPLANTGASIAIPLVIGVVLLGGGAALLIMQRKRAARD
ncbi:LPXTG cell wall anchor domain-containing protein [Actinosynnema sp. NPDC059797]